MWYHLSSGTCNENLPNRRNVTVNFGSHSYIEKTSLRCIRAYKNFTKQVGTHRDMWSLFFWYFYQKPMNVKDDFGGHSRIEKASFLCISAYKNLRK